MSATYTFTGQCYSQSGNTKKYESNLWQGVSYTESTVGGVASTSLTRSSDNINYYYTITYLPENITNGTVVTVSGSSIYAGVSKSFAFSFTGTKSTKITGYFPIIFGITNLHSSDSSAGSIDIESSANGDSSRRTVSLSSNSMLYGDYTYRYDSSNTDEYVGTIQDDITIYVNGMLPSVFGSGNSVTFGLVFDRLNCTEQVNETITIHSPQIHSGTGTWNSGKAILQDSGVLTLKIDMDNISESSLSGQVWADSVNEKFNTKAICYIYDTNANKKLKVIVTVTIQEG